jgi:hypothetical protein
MLPGAERKDYERFCTMPSLRVKYDCNDEIEKLPRRCANRAKAGSPHHRKKRQKNEKIEGAFK